MYLWTYPYPMTFRYRSNSAVFVVNFQHQHRSATLWTFKRIISKRKKNGMSPIKKRTKISFLFRRDTFMQFLFLFVMLGIDA